MISNGDQRFLAMAHKICRKSNHPQHQLGAVVVKGGAVISVACNHRHWGKHAEIRALRPHLDLTGATVYVVRNNLRCSRPCRMCRLAILAAGIKTIVFYDETHQPRIEQVV